jgi:hypothetical protein
MTTIPTTTTTTTNTIPSCSTNTTGNNITTSGTCPIFNSPCIETCQVTDEQRQAVLIDPDRPGKNCEFSERCVNSCAAYGRVCPCAARIAAHAACTSIRELMKDSHIFRVRQDADNNADMTSEPQPPDFPYVDADDITIREKLGEGGFSSVNACTVLNRKKNESTTAAAITTTITANQSDAPELEELELEGKNDTLPDVPESAEYAIKYLKKRSMVDLHTFKHGAADLAVEAL